MSVRPSALFLCLLLGGTCWSWFAHRAAAADGMEWQFFQTNDPGNKSTRLIYGVPETDNMQVSGACVHSSSIGANFSIVTFGADIGDLENGKDTELRVSGGGFDHALKGKIFRAAGEEGLSGVQVDIGNDDPLWRAFAEKDSLDYLVPGYNAASLDFTRGRDKIQQFVKACETFADATPSAATAAAGGGGDAEKEAFDSAKELGTVEAWEAFVANYPSGFHADLARAYIKKLGSATSPAESSVTGAQPADSGVTGLNVTSVRYAKGNFVKTGPDSWVEQGQNDSAVFRFKETSRTEQDVRLFDSSRGVQISLSIATGEILYGQQGGPLSKLYDIVATTGGDVAPAVQTAPAQKPAAKKATKKSGCAKGQITVDGKCMSKSQAIGYCGPGYRPQGGKCVQGYVAPKGPRPSTHGCKPGMAWSPEEGCHEDD